MTARSSSARRCPTPTHIAAAAKRLRRAGDEARRVAKAWEPTEAGRASTPLVVMTPTMSEYFEAWKNSRFVAGDKATEKALRRHLAPAGHRRHPRRPRAVYDNDRAARSPRRIPPRPSRPATTSTSCCDFVGGPRATRRPTASSSPPRTPTRSGREAQERAEAIAGQVSQAAGQLDIELETRLMRLRVAATRRSRRSLLRPRRRRRGASSRGRGAPRRRRRRALFAAQTELDRRRPRRRARRRRRARGLPRRAARAASATPPTRRPTGDIRAPRCADAVGPRPGRRRRRRSPPPAAPRAARALRGSLRRRHAGGHGGGRRARRRALAAAARVPHRDALHAPRRRRDARRPRGSAARHDRRAGGRSRRRARTCSTPTRRGCASCSTTPARGDEQRPRRARRAEAAGQAAGYFAILAAALRAGPRRGATSRRPARAFAALQATARRRRRRAFTAARSGVASRAGGLHRRAVHGPERRRAAPSSCCGSSRSSRSSTAAASPRHDGHHRLRDPGGRRVPATAPQAAFADLQSTHRQARPRAHAHGRRRRIAALGGAARHAPSGPRRACVRPRRSSGSTRARTTRSRTAMPRRVAGGDRRVGLRPDRADARPHGGRRRRRPVPAGRAGAAGGLRVLRVRARAAAEVRSTRRWRARRRGADLVRRRRAGRARDADRRARAAAPDQGDTRRARRARWRTPPRRSATAPTRRPSSRTPRSSSSARGSRRC